MINIPSVESAPPTTPKARLVHPGEEGFQETEEEIRKRLEK
jgi:hypothetical protein